MEILRNRNISEKEKKSIKILTKKFSLKEYNKKEKQENQKAKKYTLNRPINKIEDFLKKYNYQKKPLLIIGSPDHTNVLFKLFKNKIKNSYFINIKQNDIIGHKIKIDKIKHITNYNSKMFYKYVFVSSFEYLHDIVEKFNLVRSFSSFN